MSEDRDQLYDEQEQMEVVHRYEDMLKKNTRYYFDVYEFENIIEYYLESNKYQEALDANALAIEQHPESLPLQLKKAQILLDKGQPAESIKLLTRIGRIEDQNFEVYLLKGNAYCILGKVKEAIRQFDRALELTFDEKEEVLYDIALSFEHISQYYTAISYLQQAHKIDPENTSFMYDLAYCYERTGELEKSISYYKKFLDEDPFSEHVWYNLGNVYTRESRFAEALEAYDLALAIDPEYFSVYFNKANALVAEERYTEAIEVYRDYLTLDEDSVPAYCYIGECYEKLGDTEKARIQYEHALELDPESSDAWYGMAMVNLLLNNYQDAVWFLKKAIKYDKENTEFWFSLGKTQMLQKKYSEADKSFLYITELDPDDYEAYIERAQVWINKNKPETALEILNDVKERFEGITLFDLKLSYIYQLNSMVLKAGELFEKTLLQKKSNQTIEDFLSKTPEILETEPFKTIILKLNIK